MNAYNAEKYLKEAINSVFLQTYQSWEIIFWDNVSTDKTAEIVKEYDERLRYFCGENHVSLGQARNYALEKATGEYITFLDCDDLWEPEKLKLQLSLLRDKPEVKLVYSDGYIIDGKGDCLEVFSKKYNFHKGSVFKELMKKNFIPFQSIMVKKDIFKEILFSENFEVVEDLDVILKIAYKYQIDYVNQKLIKYRWHSENTSHRAIEAPLKEFVEIRKFWVNEISNKVIGVFLRRLLSKDYLNYGIWLFEQGRFQDARKAIALSLLPPCIFSLKLAYVKYFLSFLPLKFNLSLLHLFRELKACLSRFEKTQSNM